jgi:hypothetical protein
MLSFFLLLYIFHVGTGANFGNKEKIVWTREMSLNDHKFTVKYNNEDAEKLIMEISAPVRGYVAVGFSPNGGMRGSDIVMGWVDAQGKAHIKVSLIFLFCPIYKCFFTGHVCCGQLTAF